MAIVGQVLRLPKLKWATEAVAYNAFVDEIAAGIAASTISQ
jgi:hypothetical protein